MEAAKGVYASFKKARGHKKTPSMDLCNLILGPTEGMSPSSKVIYPRLALLLGADICLLPGSSLGALLIPGPVVMPEVTFCVE